MPLPPRKPSSIRTRDQGRLPVVGIGASSGGLEALRKFLSGVPADSGMAFVILLHMEPERSALLQDLLQRDTALPVREISDGLKLEPGHVYVAPPEAYVALRDGVLRLVEPEQARGQRMPIDFFFGMLAQEHLGRAIGVILSGSGSDGTAGVQAIQARCGLVAVQDPATAAYTTMPSSALETREVDVVAPAEALYAGIVAQLQRPRLRRSRPDLALADRNGTALTQILLLLCKHTGHDFSLYKKNTLYRRIERRMGSCRINRVSDYLHYLQQTPREADILQKELLISVTRFFRDSEVWEQLRCTVIPAMLVRRPEGQLFRAWVPGCASGEEAYSLAMTFCEAVEALGTLSPFSLQIFATDLDQHAIAVARKGLYPLSIAADISPQRLRRFFVAEPHGYRVCKEIREMVIFAPHNLLTDPPFGKIDLLTCRNLLIYLTPDVHETLLARFHYSMNAEAFLVLGSSESIGTATHLFKPVAGHLQLYQRLNTPLQERRLDFSAGPTAMQLSAQINPMVTPMNPGPVVNLQSMSERFLLRHYAPTAVMTTESGEILHVSGKTDDYLELAQGKAQLNILVMARERLKATLNEAFHDALRLHQAVSLISDPPDGDSVQHAVEIAVHPLSDPDLGHGMMVVFRKLASHVAAVPDPEGRSARQSARLRLLEQALQQAREEMQTTREEMQTSREELTSTNEELQSTNEELTTSAEELRTMNEELVRARSAAEQTLARYTDLFDSAPVGYFALDRSGMIVQANAAAAELLGMERDRVAGGRLVMYVSETDRPRFLACVEKTFETGEGQLCEIALWREVDMPRQVRISSLMAQDGTSCRLAVMDISERKQTEAALQSSEERFRTLWETATDVVLVLDENSIIQYVNPALRQTFGVDPEQALGRDLAFLQPEKLRSAHREGLSHFLKTGRKRTDWRLTRTLGLHADGREFPIEISFSHVQLEGRSQFAGFIRDITSRIVAETREATHARTMTLIATGTALPQVLDAIVRGVEAAQADCLCSVLLLDENNGTLRNAAAPSLPESFVAAIDGSAIGPVEGSCGTAAYFGRRVVVEEIASDPLWSKYRRLAQKAGLASCWSEPIRSSSGRVLGTFAIYHRHRHAPTEADIETIGAAARLAAIAIERHLAEEQLRRMRQLLETSQAMARIGGFELDLATDTMLWSSEMYRIHDTAPDEFVPSNAAALQFLTPRSQELVAAARKRALKEGVATDLELELITARGRHIWVEIKGNYVPAEGRPGKIVGTVQDITERKQAAAALKASEERLRLALKASHQGLFDVEVPSGRVTVNGDYATMLGYEHAEFRESLDSWMMRIHPDERDATRQAFDAYLQGKGDEFRAEFRLQTRSGDWIWVLSVGALVEFDAQGAPLRLLGTNINITERKLAEEKLELAALVYEHSSEAMMVCAADNTIIAINPAFTALTGYSADEVRGKHPRFLAAGGQDDASLDELWRNLDSEGHWQGEVWNRRKNGEVFAEALSINTIRDASGVIQRYVGLFSDITEQKESEALIWQQANFDALTHLPNRRMFRDRLQRDMHISQRDRLPLAILFIDLDRFKEINDTLGHDQGDILLVEAARRIRGCVRQSDTVARLGGDEFTVTLSELDEPERVELIAQHIIEALGAPFMLGPDQAFVSASIGITLYPNDAQDIDDLLKHADQALYAAKDAGRNRFSYFTPQMQSAALERMRLTNDLRVAVEQEQLLLYFQPVIDLASGQVCKAEALVRWQHPQRGLVNPVEFIPLAEASGLIVDIGEWVFREAARWLQRWRHGGHAEFQVSVNQSPLEFQREGRRHGGWLEYLQELGLPGHCLVVEITEGLLLDASSTVTDKLLLLRDAGIQVALDDFGTGYSSLSYLKKFDIDYLKIDQSFTRNLAPGSSDMALSEAIIVMAHKLGLKVIAEGVETTQQRDLLQAAGCDYGQGFLFAEPMPAPAFDALLREAGSSA